MENQLIKIKKNNFNGAEVNSVNARELWLFLESKQKFADWIKARISQYDFTENEDYIVHKNMNASTQQVESIEYIITIDVAKELGMVERNEKGREVRKYFIEVEKAYKESISLSPAEFLLQQAKILVEQERKMKELEAVQKEQAIKIAVIQDKLESILPSQIEQLKKICNSTAYAKFRLENIKYQSAQTQIYNKIKAFAESNRFEGIRSSEVQKVFKYAESLRLDYFSRCKEKGIVLGK